MKVALLLSGGVDSSVALRLLQEQGHEVTAFYLKIWLEDELSHLGQCPWEEDLHFARAVCEAAGVELQVVPLQRQYHEHVVAWAIEELRQGRTPSPDILCNRRVKFGVFFEQLEAQHGPRFDKVASGHYARLQQVDDRWQLLRGVDAVKDQTYFLYRLDQEQLGRCLFPLGGLAKSDVRELAERFQLANRQRPDSQGICFLGKIPFDDFVGSYLGEQPGDIREINSQRLLGRHRGLWFHTIGQRKGLGLHGGPWYVVHKDVASQTLYVSHKNELPDHRRDHFNLDDVHWIAERPPSTQSVQVRIRHSPSLANGHLELIDDHWTLQLAEADPGVAEGQSAVIYDGEVCLGGGTIREANRSNRRWPVASGGCVEFDKMTTPTSRSSAKPM